MGFVRGVATNMMEATIEDLRININQTQSVSLFRNLIKNIKPQMAAIEKYQPRYKIFEKFIDEIADNFFKYKEFREAAFTLTEEVSTPFVESAVEEANITQDQIDACKAGDCIKEAAESEIHLIAPIEILKVQSQNLDDIGAGHFLKLLLDGNSKIQYQSNFKSDLETETGKLINKLFGSNYQENMIEFSKYLSYNFLKHGSNVKSKEGFNSIGDITKSKNSKCGKDNARLYSIFWKAFLFNDKQIKYNCSMVQKHCSEINPDCFESRYEVDCSQVTLTNPPCHDDSISEEFKFKPCCDFVKSFTDNFEATLKLMKYSIQAVHFQESQEEESRVFQNITDAFADSKYFLKELSNRTRRNFNNYIPLCQYAGDPEEMTFENCDLFRRSMSNMGLSFSFNTNKYWNIYQRNNYNELFNRIMYPNVEKSVYFPDSSGPDYRLRFLLNGKLIPLLLDNHIHYANTFKAFTNFLKIFCDQVMRTTLLSTGRLMAVTTPRQCQSSLLVFMIPQCQLISEEKESRW